MKEWFIRLMCVLLGVAITLGTIEATEVINRLQNKETAVVLEEEVTPVVVAEAEPTVEPEEIIQDYELEAELKYQEMVESIAPTPEPEVEVQEIPEYPPNSIEAAPVRWIRDYPSLTADATLEDKLAVRSSYDETLAVNAFDKKVIENSSIDFSDVKITVIGDSISAGNTLPEDEMEQYNWPAQLKAILGCKEIVNLSIGGSNISTCADNYPMVKRWNKIEPDSDIIIVMGGSNDMLFETREMFGELDANNRMQKDTFCGDLDRMLSGIKWTYVDHNEENYCKLICINPMATILNDGVYNVDPENMLKQEEFANAINVIASQYEYGVIDLYNNNILNSHDRDINEQFVPDGIHCNKEGYRILAEHIASQLIQRIEQ